ncbi:MULTISPECIES: ABC transporter permease [Bacillus cereus group]|uniref:ABC transporter permease n=1 Tax=Bacillus cereus group TaxID=86661 RepID=UPI000BEBEAEA|nr:ABC transporter permease subunit [Bacillus toyonensis]MED2709025.1 ABC transporter permease subunit [Bacillus toyonensis]MED2742342.1 ABC transporter permease subunit [Bacillus toyonensis]PDZ26801.1 hypothetical protein CON85_20500 [Bacillus toyonensis]PEB17038.1 hypothetical protein COO08_19255 [Bacillus toyonensis]PEK45365.1 hypothetical protein CN592_23015 [Bacillus toyonensis]
MFGISLREFKSLFKSIKSMIFICIMFGVTLLIANFLKGFESNLAEAGLKNIYTGGLLGLILVLGPLFVMSLSHDIINNEIYNRTIRFLVTKTSRDNIVLGKFLGVLLFWFVCLFLSIFMLFFISKEFYFKELITMTIFMSYFICLSLFLSTVISKPSMTMFISIIISILFPVIGMWGVVSDNNIILDLFGYLMPYYYFSQPGKDYLMFIVVIFPIIFLLASLLIFRKRDF